MTGYTLLEGNWNTSISDNTKKATWYGLYAKQKNLYQRNSNASVVSGMIYGAQYDAIMNWMKEIQNPTVSGVTYIKNSEGMGWYNNNYGVGNPNHLTGLDYEGVNNKVNNIYDLAGNYREWTQEAYTYGSRVHRGGSYADDGLEKPASHRNSISVVTSNAIQYSSRLQLYIK